MEVSSPVLWLIGLLGSGFMALVGWVSVRLVGRLDALTLMLHEDFRDLMHQHDLRISRLESWRDMGNK